jgi:hypothetical protein
VWLLRVYLFKKFRSGQHWDGAGLEILLVASDDTVGLFVVG